MRSKVSFGWLPSYIKATRPVLEIFQMAGYFVDSPLTSFFNKSNPTSLWLADYVEVDAEVIRG